MTLRVTLSIVPHGIETDVYDIATYNISNLGLAEDDLLTKYLVEVNTYKTSNNGKPIYVYHNRADGAGRLVEMAMNAIIDHKDT